MKQQTKAQRAVDIFAILCILAVVCIPVVAVYA